MEEIVNAPLVAGEINYNLVYAWFGIAVCISLWLVSRCQSNYKPELFFLSFYFLTGNANELLTLSIPGLSFFEIQPDRFLFLLFSFLLARRLLFSRGELPLKFTGRMPGFKIALYLYVAWIIISQIYHTNDLGVSDVILSCIYAINVLILIYGLQLITDRESLRVIGTVIVIGAVVTSLVSLVQISVDQLFMKIGDQRIAFGSTLRSNGIFNNEYCNAYFIITALAWTLTTVKNSRIKYLLYALFAAAVFSTFMRMSWLILIIISAIYFLKIEKIAFEKLAVLGLVGIISLLTLFIVYNREIMNSGIVKERLSEAPDSRLGYYKMVTDNIGKKPLFGYGGKNNELYYYSMLLITHSRKRATGEEGDIHSGYFSSLFYYGVPGLLFFIAFVFLSLFYFGPLYSHHTFFAIPFLLGLLYAIGNLSNTLLLDQYMAIIYAMHLGLGLGVRHMSDFASGDLAAFNE